MKRISLLLSVAALSVAWSQTAPSPAAKPSSPTATKAPAASTTKPATKPASSAPSVAPWVKLPPGVPVFAHGPVKIPFELRYEDIKVGAGPIAAQHKVYRVEYTGWLAADGHKFDSSADHPPEVVYDSSLHQVKGDDGKPVMKAGQPMLFVQGDPRMIPGWNLGFDGMHVGGKRRLFIPYQMAYGELGRQSPDPKHPGIPPKSDLIFDIELVEMMDQPAQPAPPTRPGMPRPMPVQPHPGAGAQPNAAPTQPATPAAPAANAPAPPPQSTAPAQPPATAPAPAPAPATAPAQTQPK